MKKIMALFACLAFSTACLAGCASKDEVFTRKNYTAPAEEITEVSIDVRDRQIEVIRSADNQIHIDYFENDKEYYDISVSNGHTLTMTGQSNKNWADYIGGKSAADFRKISLQLPDTILTALKLSTTNEDISLCPLTAVGDLSLSSHGGNLVFDKLNAENSIYLDAKNGEISGKILGSYEDYAIFCDSKKGKSNLPANKENGTKTLTVFHNNGDVDIEFING